MERGSPGEEHPPPSRHASVRRRGSADAGQSLESFALATTPFHEPAADGEFYMDETGAWLHRWVTHTDVHAAKARPPATGKRRDAPPRPASDDPDAGKEDSGWEDGPAGDAAAAAASSASSASSGVDEERQLRRPPLHRHSRSSVIPAHRANHKSPERVAAIGRPEGRQEETPEDEQSACPNTLAPDAQETPEHVPLHLLTRTLSCPSAPTQLPVLDDISSTLSDPPSPRLARADIDAPAPAPATRRMRSRTDRSRRTARAPRPWPDMQLHRAATEDPYVAHQRAMELFAPQRSQPEPAPETRRRASFTAPVAPPARTVPAAEFLASKPAEVPATIPTHSRRASQAESTGRTAAETALHQRASRSTLDHSTAPASHGPLGIAAAEAPPAAPDVSHLPVLVDHRIAIDWTHPATREKAARKRRGVVSKVKRLLSRSRSRSRRRSAAGGADDDYADAGSVRKLRVESIAKVVREEAIVNAEVAEVDREPHGLERGTETSAAKKSKRRWSFLG